MVKFTNPFIKGTKVIFTNQSTADPQVANKLSFVKTEHFTAPNRCQKRKLFSYYITNLQVSASKFHSYFLLRPNSYKYKHE